MAYGYGQQPNLNVPQLQQSQQVMGQQNIQPLFPQPTGNVYNINSTLEVANVPVGAGVSIALCLPENVMYIKTMQNGNPLFYPYKIIPFNNETERYFTRMREGMENYDAGRSRYRDGGSNERMVEGIEMTMGAIVNFIESLMDIAETSQEKEIVRKYVDRIKKY